MALAYGSGGGLLVLATNSPPVLSNTEGYPVFHLAIVAMGLYMLSLSPLLLLHGRLVGVLDCSRLFTAQAVGVAAGFVSILPLALISGFVEYVAYATQLLITLGLGLFFAMYDVSFSNLFDEISKTGIPRSAGKALSLISRKGFSRMLLAANVFAAMPIIALLIGSQFALAGLLVAFQALSSLVGLGLHALSLRWVRTNGSPPTPPFAL